MSSDRAGLARLARGLVSLVLGVTLAACGGGGGGSAPRTTPDTPTVYGTAATGAAFAGTISLEDATGHVSSLAVSGGSGQFSFSAKGLVAPFMLKAVSTDGSVVLYSAAAAPGRANITPLTSLALLRLAARWQLHGPADLYTVPASFGSRITSGELAQSATLALSRLMPAFVSRLPGTPPSYQPFTATYAVGDDVDRLLDAYPISFAQDAAGVVAATQREVASGFAVQVARSDTIAAAPSSIEITNGLDVAAGSSVRLAARAVFPGGATQDVPATWLILGGGAGSSLGANGLLAVPPSSLPDTVRVQARWSDGENLLTAEATLRIVPLLQPVSLQITGAPALSLGANSSVALGAQVHWSDGTVTTPVVDWSWSGDASAVRSLGADGTLATGAPASDQSINVSAAFGDLAHRVSATVTLTVRRYVPLVESASIVGLPAGQSLLAGDDAHLALTVHRADGTEATLTPSWWGAAPAGGTNPAGTVSITSDGHLVASPAYGPRDAGPDAQAPTTWIVSATYDIGDGTLQTALTQITVRPLADVPVGLTISGATRLDEGSATYYQASVAYADGGSQPVEATWASQDASFMKPLSGSGFQAGTYASKPDQPQSTQITATHTVTTIDGSGQTVTTTLTGSLDVAIDWLEPYLTEIALPTDLDFVVPGQPSTVVVTGTYYKLGQYTRHPVADARLSADGTLVSVDGLTLSATAAPSTPDQSWTTLTAEAQDATTGSHFQVTRNVTVPMAAVEAKRLLSVPWTPVDLDVQFRAISTDGYLDEYVVQRNPDTGAYGTGFYSPTSRRHVPFFSAVSDFAEGTTVDSETLYVAAVLQGRVAVMRRDDLLYGFRQARPVLLPAGVAAATAVALIVKADATATPAASRLYVLDTAGALRQYRLPYRSDAPLADADVVFERQLSGTFLSISAGAQHLVALRSDGTVVAEGSNANGQVGDPAPGATGWHEEFQVQRQFYNLDGPPYTLTVATLTGVDAVWAERDASMAGTTESPNGHYQEWGLFAKMNCWVIPGRLEAGCTDPRPAAVEIEFLAGPPRAMVDGAFVQADGTVFFHTSFFLGGGGVDLWPGGATYYTQATWLPPVRQLVAGRRQVYGSWPTEPNLVPLMPVALTEADRVIYLDGTVVNGADGQPLVLP
jgi:hypothetical protein